MIERFFWPCLFSDQVGATAVSVYHREAVGLLQIFVQISSWLVSHKWTEFLHTLTNSAIYGQPLSRVCKGLCRINPYWPFSNTLRVLGLKDTVGCKPTRLLGKCHFVTLHFWFDMAKTLWAQHSRLGCQPCTIKRSVGLWHLCLCGICVGDNNVICAGWRYLQQ